MTSLTISNAVDAVIMRPAGSTGRPTLTLDFIADPTTALSRLTFTRASSATRVNASGVIETVGSNVARLDYDPATLAARGLLIEEARTNLLLNSATLSTQNVTVTAVAHTLSFYGTGTVTLSGASTAGPLVGGGAYPTRSTLTFTPSAGTLTLTVTGSVLWAQLEVGSFATSWVPTTGTTATRAADVASMLTSAVPNFNAAAFTMVLRVASRTPATNNAQWAQIDSGDSADIYSVLHQSDDQAVWRARRSNSDIIFQAFGTLTDGVAANIGVAFQSGNSAVSMNGGTPTNSTATWSDPGLTTLRIGCNQLSQQQINGWVSSLEYYPRRIPNTELQGKTS